VLQPSGTQDSEPGRPGWVGVEFVAPWSRTFHCGVQPRSGWACNVKANARMEDTSAGTLVTMQWEYEVDASAMAEAQYLRPVVVSRGHISVGRLHVFCKAAVP
jgi:hypothetical protein